MAGTFARQKVQCPKALKGDGNTLTLTKMATVVQKDVAPIMSAPIVATSGERSYHNEREGRGIDAL